MRLYQSSITVRSSGSPIDSGHRGYPAGAGVEVTLMWSRWVDSGGDVPAAASWSRRGKAGVTNAEVEEAFPLGSRVRGTLMKMLDRGAAGEF